jgi:3-oxoacyl-[acyl-carrier-protein] synthase III
MPAWFLDDMQMAKLMRKKQIGLRPGGDRRYAHVVGWGVEIPERILTNQDIEKMVDTSDSWIRERTGIAERRIADDRDTTVTLGTRAARKALNHADVNPSEVDLIVVATSSPTFLFPSTACLIQDRLGSENAGAFDVLAACTGFIYALGIASAQIKAGMIDTALVIGTETLSRIVDWTDRGTCILFADGAGAWVLQASEVPGGVQEVVMHSDGSGGDLLSVPSGVRPTWNGAPAPDVVTQMNGREVFRFATRVMVSATEEVLERANLRKEDIDLVVPHQANLRIIQAAARGLHLPMDKFVVNIERYGNTSTASIPIAVDEAVQCQQLKQNDKVVLVGFGGGLTWGAALVEWDVTASPRAHAREIVREGWYILARVRSLARRVFRFLEAVLGGSPTKEAIRAERRTRLPQDNSKK